MSKLKHIREIHDDSESTQSSSEHESLLELRLLSNVRGLVHAVRGSYELYQCKKDQIDPLIPVYKKRIAQALSGSENLSICEKQRIAIEVVQTRSNSDLKNESDSWYSSLPKILAFCDLILDEYET